MQSILDKLTENMQIIYRKAVDADQALTKLQQSGKGKYQNIFADDSGFEINSKRFMPYVEELANQVALLIDADKAEYEKALPSIVKKMELLLVTLTNFQQTLKQ